MTYTDFVFKKLTSIHDRLTTEMNKCILKTEIPEWTTKGKTTLIQKDPIKRTASNNNWPITWLSIIWKILIAQIREQIYNWLISPRLFLKGQKGCHKGTWGTVDLLFRDQRVLSESKTRQINLGMAWIDCKKKHTIWYPKDAYYTVSNSIK